MEYAADVGKRWYLEQRLVLAGKPVPSPWKCARPQNAEAWRLVTDEFFGSVDLTPPCPGAARQP
jgi:hypothetical protein